MPGFTSDRFLPDLRAATPYLSRRQARQHLERHGQLVATGDLAETNDLLEARRAALRQSLLTSHTRTVVADVRVVARDATEAVEAAPAAASMLGEVLASYSALSSDILHRGFGPR